MAAPKKNAKSLSIPTNAKKVDRKVEKKVDLNPFKACLAHALLQSQIIGKKKALEQGIQPTAEIITNAISDGETQFTQDVLLKVEEIINKAFTMTPRSSSPTDDFQTNVKQTFDKCVSTETVTPEDIALLVWLPKIIKDNEIGRAHV